MVYQSLIILLVTINVLQFSLADENVMHELESQLLRSKYVVRSTTSSIKRFKVELQLSSNSELKIPKQQSKYIVQQLVQAMSTEINHDVKEAIQKGTYAAHFARCIENLQSILFAIPEDKEGEFEKCQNNALQTVATQMNVLNIIIGTGNHLISQLDSVYSRCSGRNSFKVRNCIAVLLKGINQQIDLFERDAIAVKKQTQIITSTSIDLFKKCNAEVVETVRVKIARMKREIPRCLNDTWVNK